MVPRCLDKEVLQYNNLSTLFTHAVIDEGIYLIKSNNLNRYILQTGSSINGNRGDEEGWSSSPNVVASDANYDDRAYWKITRYHDETHALYYLINVVTQRYLFQTGELIRGRGREGGWLRSPHVVGTDDSYDDRHIWKIIPRPVSIFHLVNFETDRYLFETAPTAVIGNRGDEGGWNNSSPLVGSDANYYNQAYFNFMKIASCDPSNPCGAHATCNDIDGYFICTCNSGYTDDDTNCIGRMHDSF